MNGTMKLIKTLVLFSLTLCFSRCAALRLGRVGKSYVRFKHFLSLPQLHASINGFSTGIPIRGPQVATKPATSTDVAPDIILHHFNEIQGQSLGSIAILGTSELNKNQQQVVEMLSYALILSGNHVYTSGGGDGTNIAVIRGALRAGNPDLLTVMLPQSLDRQPGSMQILLKDVQNLLEQPENDGLGLREAAQLCNYRLMSMVDKVIVFVYHDSATILNPLEEFEEVVEVVRFFLD